jgi:hypothetical protein
MDAWDILAFISLIFAVLSFGLAVIATFFPEIMKKIMESASTTTHQKH